MNTRYNVLVVEDDVVMEKIVIKRLSRVAEVYPAASLAKAREILQDSTLPIDLVILDHQLPDGSGLDLVPEIRAERKPWHTKILMVSGNASADLQVEALTAGVDDYLTKPINVQLLNLKAEALLANLAMAAEVKAQRDQLQINQSANQKEQEMAKFVYGKLLERGKRDVPGFSWYSRPHSIFSGDIAICGISDSGHVIGMLADATGHGLPAALTLVPAVSVFRNMLRLSTSLGTLAYEINHRIYTDLPDDRFIAAILFEVNPFEETLTVWNGGMPDAIWLGLFGEIEHRFPSEHLPLGMPSSDKFGHSVVTVPLPREGHFFCYSDGAIEQSSKYGEMLSIDVFEKGVRETPEDPFDGALRVLNEHIGAGTLEDDVSFVTFRVTPEHTSLFERTAPAVSGYSWTVKSSGAALASGSLVSLAHSELQGWGLPRTLLEEAFTVLSELITNALDHGVLGLSSAIKEKHQDFGVYASRQESAMKNLKATDFVKVTMQLYDRELMIEVTDSGEGFDLQEVERLNAVQENRFCGLGLQMVRGLTKYLGQQSRANQVTAIMDVERTGSQ